MFDLYVFTFHHDGQIYRSLSLLSPTEVEQYGLPTEAVLGEISALLPTMTPDQFEANPSFVKLLHETVQVLGPTLPDLQTKAQTQGTGYVYILDGRVPSHEHITPEDVLGQFKVRRGEIIGESYIPNPEYRLLTDSGPLQLPLAIEELMLKKIRFLLDKSSSLL